MYTASSRAAHRDTNGIRNDRIRYDRDTESTKARKRMLAAFVTMLSLSRVELNPSFAAVGSAYAVPPSTSVPIVVATLPTFALERSCIQEITAARQAREETRQARMRQREDIISAAEATRQAAEAARLEAEAVERARVEEAALAERARIEAAAQAALEIERRAAAERAEADAAAQRQRQELIGEFRAITGCDNEEHLALFLGAYNDNLERAVSAYFEHDGDVTKLPNYKPPAVHAQPIQSNSSSAGSVAAAVPAAVAAIEPIQNAAVSAVASSVRGSSSPVPFVAEAPREIPAASSNVIAASVVNPAVQIRVRLPTGETIQGEFRDTDNLMAVYEFVNNRGAASFDFKPFSLLQVQPRVEFTQAQLQRSVRELGLHQATLVCVLAASSS